MAIAAALAAGLGFAPPASAIPNADADPSWGTNGHVSAIVQVGDMAIVGGTFTEIEANGGAGPATLVRHSLAAFDATTGQPISGWAPDVNGEVAALAVSADGRRIYAGGKFTTVDGLTRTRLVALSTATGVVDSKWKPSAGYNVGALLLAGSRVYVGGAFTTMGGTSRQRLGAVDATSGSLDATWVPAADGEVRALTVSPDGSRILAGGDFNSVSGLTRKGLVALDPATGAVLDWHPDPGYRIFGIATDSTTIYTAGGGRANALAAWDAATGTRRWVSSSDGDFQAIGISGGILYAGGHFLYYDGHLDPKRVVAVDASTGNLRPDWVPRVRGGTMGVWAISISAGRVLLGGDFTEVGSQPHGHYAQFTGPTDGPAEVDGPSPPSGLFAGAVGGSKVKLTWTASTDDVGVSGYTVVRNGVEIGRASATTYADETVQANTRYTYEVRAFDSVSNVSAPSNTAAVTTGPSDAVFTLSPTDDAYVDSSLPATNSGSSSSLKVDGDPRKETLLRFAVVGVGNRQVVSAKLRIYCTDDSNDGGHIHRASSNAWSEQTVTWNTAPDPLEPEIANFSDVDAGTWYTVDVTPLVTGDGDVSAVIDSSISNPAQYASKEGSASLRPQLIVNVATAGALPFSDGFESGDFSNWSGVSGLLAQQQHVSTGAWAARATTTGAAASASKDLTQSQSELYQQLRFKVLSQGANQLLLLRLRASTGTVLKVYLDSAGRLAYRNDFADTTTTSAIRPSAGIWHTIQVHTLVSGATGEVEVWLDGAKLSALSKTESLGSLPIERLQLGDDSTGRTYDVVYDDFAVDSSAIPDTTPPTAPTDLTATASTATTVALSWTPSTDDIGVTGYEVYRGGALIGTVGGATSSYVDATASAGTSYAYVVTAIDAAQNRSQSSDPALATTPPPDTTPPSTPTRLEARTVSFDRVDLSWAASSDGTGVERYRIHRNGSLLATVDGASLSYRDSAVVGSGSYSYTVDAVDAAGNASSQSDPAVARTPSPALFRDGFESGDMSQWTGATRLSIGRQETFSGEFGARATTAGAATYATKQLAQSQNEVYYRLRFKVLSQGDNSLTLGRLRTPTGGGLVRLYVQDSGKLAYRNDVSGTTSTATTKPTLGSWHTADVHVVIGNLSGRVEVWLDGSRLMSKSESLGSTQIGRLQLGDDASGRVYDVAYDDVAADTAALGP